MSDEPEKKPKFTVTGNPPEEGHWNASAPAPIDPVTKQRACSRCKTSKPLTSDHFHRNSAHPDGFHRSCKECRSTHDKRSHAGNEDYLARMRSWRKKNNTRVKDYALRRFGLPLGGFAQMSVEQNNCCAICGRAPDDSLQLDHDHSTGVIRELLCGACNRGLGHFLDDPSLLETAAAYLRRHHDLPRLAIPRRIG